MRRIMLIAAAVLVLSSCGSDSDNCSCTTSPTPSGTRIVRETVTGTIGSTSLACSGAFERSVDQGYYAGGMRVCAEFSRVSTTAGMVSAVLSWDDRRIDLDLVLNDGVGSNFKQSIAANRHPERLDAFVNAGTSYVLVVYLRGVDPQFLANGGSFPGTVSTPFTLTLERPE